MENRTTDRRRRFVRTLALLALTAGTAYGLRVTAEGSALSSGSPNITTSPVYWNWDPVNAEGSSKLVRTPAGLSFTYHTSSLPVGQVVTVWIVVFNNPEHCATTPCTAPADVGNPDVNADFLYGGGHVIGGSGRGNFGGHLAVGDASGSGLAELGFPAVGLLEPFTAEVQLALHSHGPAMSGQVQGAADVLPGRLPDVSRPRRHRRRSGGHAVCCRRMLHVPVFHPPALTPVFSGT